MKSLARSPLSDQDSRILEAAIRQAIASERSLLGCVTPPIGEDERRIALVAAVKVKAFGQLYNKLFRPEARHAGII